MPTTGNKQQQQLDKHESAIAGILERGVTCVVYDEGSSAANTRHLNFVGAGVNVISTSSGKEATINIPGGSGSPPTGTGYRHVTAGIEDAAAYTPTQVTADLNIFVASTAPLKGLVPSPGSTGIGLFLRDDATWQSPGGGGTAKESHVLLAFSLAEVTF